jgi:tripartite-type tricarboxylate transporter receptor subunit TctC
MLVMNLLRQLWKPLHLCAGLLACAVWAGPAMGQAFPSKTFSVVVPYPAGGASDFVARLIQPEYQKQMGQQLIVENIGGVGGALGVQKVLAAPADGHTQVLATPMELVLSPMALSAVKFKPEDVRLASLIANTSVLMLVRPNAPVGNLDEFIAWAKGKSLTAGNVGVGSLYHLMAEKFAQQAGLQFTHVPYKGGSPLITDIASGTLDLAFFPLAGPVPGMVKEGRAKAIGIAAPTPHALFPNVPAISAHKTFPGFNFDIWIGVQVPKATPDAVVDRINTAMNAVLQNADVRKGLEGTGGTMAAAMNRAELDRLYTAEIERYRAMARSINLTPQ